MRVLRLVPLKPSDPPGPFIHRRKSSGIEGCDKVMCALMTTPRDQAWHGDPRTAPRDYVLTPVQKKCLSDYLKAANRDWSAFNAQGFYAAIVKLDEVATTEYDLETTIQGHLRFRPSALEPFAKFEDQMDRGAFGKDLPTHTRLFLKAVFLTALAF